MQTTFLHQNVTHWNDTELEQACAITEAENVVNQALEVPTLEEYLVDNLDLPISTRQLNSCNAESNYCSQQLSTLHSPYCSSSKTYHQYLESTDNTK